MVRSAAPGTPFRVATAADMTVRRVPSTSEGRMSKTVKLRAALVAVGFLATAALTQSADAGSPAAAATPTRSTAKGQLAQVGGTTTSPLACADGSSGQESTTFFLAARTDVTLEGSTRVSSKVVEMFLSTSESCGNTRETRSGSTDVPANYSQRTRSVTLVAAVPLLSDATGTTSTVNVSLAFAAAGTPHKTRDRVTISGSGTLLMFRQDGMSTDATVTGSVAVEGGRNLLTGATDVFATFSADALSSVSVLRASHRSPGAATLTRTSFSPAAAGTTSTTTADNGQTADLTLTKVRQLTCADGSSGQELSNLFLLARTNVARDRSTSLASKNVRVFVSTSETCDGTDASSSASTDTPTVYSQSGAVSATLSTTMVLVDDFTGTPAATIDLSLGFQAVNAPIRRREHGMASGPGTLFVFRSDANFSDAAVTGSLTIGGGPNLLTSATGAFAQLGTQATGSLSVTRAQHPTR
jgi:hypothetical protein